MEPLQHPARKNYIQIMKKLTLLSLLFLTLFACRKDIDETNTVSVTEEPPVTVIVDYDPEIIDVTATLFGTVSDESGNPVADAAVTLGSNETTTDESGRFLFKDITMNQAGTYVEVKQNNYFPGSYRFFPEESSVNYTSIVLMDKTNKGSFNATEGGIISDAEGIGLDFPANAIVTADGAAYNGTVEVYARWIDPTADNLMEIMPGDLQGLNTGLEEVALGSYGMMAVELETPAGQALNLGNGQKATLTFPVPAELLADAPSEIPLWSFNETYGIWVEEGSATLNGNEYIGEVAHFSFWNCDYPYPLIQLSGTIITQNGTPLANAWVKLTMNNGNSRFAYTNNNGTFSGKVPQDEAFVMEVGQYYYCPEVFYTANIGPFTADTDLGDIVVDAEDHMLEVTGTVLDCNGDPLTNGVIEVTLEFGYPHTAYITDGTVNMAILNCNDTSTVATVIATNFDDFEQSDVLTYSVVDPLDLGTVNACGNQLAEYLLFTIDGMTTTFVDVTFVSGGPDSTFLWAGSAGQNDYNLNMGFDEITGAGTYTGDIVQYVSGFVPGNSSDYWWQCSNNPTSNNCGIDAFEITAYGAIGEPIEGTFSGTTEFNDNSGQVVTLPYNAEFKINRQ